MLDIIFQQCTIQAEAPPDIFCGAMQEFCDCLVLVVEVGNWFNIEKEIWEGDRKGPVVGAALTGALRPEKAQHQKESHYR